MAMMSQAFEGGAAMVRNLEKLAQPMQRQIKIDALKAAAEPMRDRMELLAPVSFEGDPHLADNIIIGTLTERQLEARGRDSETVIEVGPAGGKTGNDFFYGFFLEYGTAHMPPQPFARPAFDQTAQQALDILSDELWFAIARQLPSSQERFVA